MKLFKSICLLAFFSQLQVIAEIKRNPEVRYGSIQEYRNRQALLEKGTPKSSNQGHHPVSRSDLGFQRPVETKKHGFGYHFGFESKLLHSNNPASAPDSNSIIDSAGIWENALSNNFLLGAYDLGGASFSPIVGLGLSNSSYFGDDDLDVLNSNNLNISFVGIFQFSKGWSVRGGLSSSFDFNTAMSQTYRQTSPTLGISKGFSIGTASAFSDFSLSYHFTDTNSIIPSEAEKMDRFETALIFGIDIPFNNFEFSPYLRFCLGNYSNQDRKEFTTNAGLDISYHFYDWLAMKFLLSYSNRNASGQDGGSADFSRFDFGSAISLSAQF
jgi:hypothetical protein